MFQEMKEHSLRCDELVYNTLMEGCAACANQLQQHNTGIVCSCYQIGVGRHLTFWNRTFEAPVMCQLDHQLPVYDWGLGPSGCVKADDWKAGRAWDVMVENVHALQFEVEDKVGMLYLRPPHPHRIVWTGCGLFAEMVNKGLKPSAITASILSRLSV